MELRILELSVSLRTTDLLWLKDQADSKKNPNSCKSFPGIFRGHLFNLDCTICISLFATHVF